MGVSGIKLTATKVEKMWQLFAIGTPIQAISKKVSVSRLTIAKYRDSKGWVKRRDKINRRASKKSDTQAVNLMAENLKIVRFSKQKLFNQIKDARKKGNGKSKTPYADLDKIIRLEAFLGGAPDSRPETVTPKDELADKSYEELLIIRKRIVGGNGHITRKRIASKVKDGGNGNGDKPVHS